VTTESLTPIEAVRKRPGMYVGGTGGTGVLHLVLEVVANALDQYLAGRCTTIAIAIAGDGMITVEDDGPGISAEAREGRPPLDVLLHRPSNLPTVDGHRPHVHLGLGGLGLFVVNALAERFELRSVRDGVEASIAYERGQLAEELVTRSTARPDGTTIRFRPDREIFEHPRLGRDTLARQLEDLSFLVPGLALRWSVEGDDMARDGMVGRVALATPCQLDEVAHHSGTYPTSSGPIQVSVALAWRGQNEPYVDSFVNLGRTRDHGHHVDGLAAGIRRFLGGRQQQRHAGLVAAVSIVLADVTYGEPTASRAVAPQAKPVVAEATVAALEAWAERRPERAAEIRARVKPRAARAATSRGRSP
jgi:DNA gyrase subunit B